MTSLIFVIVCAVAGDALAIIGRPLTPLSVAGVARRTTRRAVYAGSYAAAATYPTVATLPHGCTPSGTYYSCAGSHYRPYYDGPDLVYVEVEDRD